MTKSVLDGFSRYIVHWELRETMKECDIELVVAKGIEKHPGVKPRIISDNGPHVRLLTVRLATLRQRIA